MNEKEQKRLETIKEFGKKLPKFPDGRINYSNSAIAPVITVFVKYKDKILILKRSDKVRTYQGKWNTVAGYLDELKPIHEKIVEELEEELGIDKNNISRVRFGEPYQFTDDEVNKTWIVHPALIELKQKPNIKLNWEHTEFKWIDAKDIIKYDVVSRLDESLKRVLK